MRSLKDGAGFVLVATRFAGGATGNTGASNIDALPIVLEAASIERNKRVNAGVDRRRLLVRNKHQVLHSITQHVYWVRPERIT